VQLDFTRKLLFEFKQTYLEKKNLINSKSSRFALIHDYMCRSKKRLNLRDLCNEAEVSISGYYRWVETIDKRKEREERDLREFNLIKEAHDYGKYAKGHRRIKMTLEGHEFKKLNKNKVMNKKKIIRLKNKYGLFYLKRVPDPYKAQMRQEESDRTFLNLLDQKFRQHGKRSVMLSDTTYIKTDEGKYVFFTAVKDAYTKEILAYKVSRNNSTKMALDVFNDLISRHGDEMNKDKKTIFHSDQGAIFKSKKFVKLVEESGMAQSMSRKGMVWDNAPMESYIGHMKTEVDFDGQSYEEICRLADDYVEYYNTKRHQWGLDRLTPREYFNRLNGCTA
jgi:transposase InsO family protein